MKILHTKALTKKQTLALKNLVNACRETDSPSLSTPLDADEYYFLYENPGTLLACLALFLIKKNEWEAAAFTHPAHRKYGYFKTLLARSARRFRFRSGRFIFAVESPYTPAIQVLKKYHAHFCAKEYLLTLNLKTVSDHAQIRTQRLSLTLMPPLKEICSLSPQKKQATPPGKGIYRCLVRAYLCRDNPNPPCAKPVRNPTSVGTCLLNVSGETIYLFSFEIRKKLRGQGLGNAFMHELILRLKGAGFSCLSLQVSSVNIPAMHLYKKAGFKSRQMLLYYQLSIRRGQILFEPFLT